MSEDLSVSGTIKFNIDYRKIEYECLDYLVDVGEKYLDDNNIEFFDLYVENLFTIIKRILFSFINYQIPFLTPFYSLIKNKEKWDVARIIVAYLYLSNKLPKHYSKKSNYINIFRKGRDIKDIVEILVEVVKRLFVIYFIEEIKILNIAVLIITKNRMGETMLGKEEDLVKILDLASYAGITFGELRRWFYYFNTEDVLNYLSNGYTLERALEEVEDDDEGEEDEEE